MPEAFPEPSLDPVANHCRAHLLADGKANALLIVSHIQDGKVAARGARSPPVYIAELPVKAKAVLWLQGKAPFHRNAAKRRVGANH